MRVKLVLGNPSKYLNYRLHFYFNLHERSRQELKYKASEEPSDKYTLPSRSTIKKRLKRNTNSKVNQ